MRIRLAVLLSAVLLVSCASHPVAEPVGVLNVQRIAVLPLGVIESSGAYAHNNDCEAATVVNGRIWVFSKHWQDLHTRLYQIDPWDEQPQTLQPVGRGLARWYCHDWQALSGYNPVFALFTDDSSGG
jgi:hypothetical protein